MQRSKERFPGGEGRGRGRRGERGEVQTTMYKREAARTDHAAQGTEA